MKIGGDTILLVLLALIVSVIIFYDGGIAMIRKGSIEGVKMFLGFIPMFVVAFFIVGQSKVLMDKYVDVQWLGTWLSGGRGILFAFLGGIVTPVVLPFFPILRSLWDVGVGRAAIIMFLMALALNWQVLLFRVPFLGWKITLISMGGTFSTLILVAVFLVLMEKFIR